MTDPTVTVRHTLRQLDAITLGYVAANLRSRAREGREVIELDPIETASELDGIADAIRHFCDHRLQIKAGQLPLLRELAETIAERLVVVVENSSASDYGVRCAGWDVITTNNRDEAWRVARAMRADIVERISGEVMKPGRAATPIDVGIWNPRYNHGTERRKLPEQRPDPAEQDATGDDQQHGHE